MNRALAFQLGAASLLLLLALSALTMMRVQRRRARLAERIAQQASSYGRAAVVAARPDVRDAASAARTQSILRFGTWLLGFDPARQDHYPVPWWIVLPAALVMARIVLALAQILLGAAALLLLPLLWVFIVRRFYHWCEKRHLQRLYEQFPDALAMLVRAVRVGIPIVEGMRAAARESPQPTGQEFTRLVDQIAIGVTMEEALHDLATRNAVQEYRFFATALALQSETGGAVSETLERLAEVIRKRVALRSHANALASEARTSIYILAALPVLSGAALAVLSPDYIAVLFTEPAGRRLFAIALISLGIGFTSMRTLVRRSLS